METALSERFMATCIETRRRWKMHEAKDPKRTRRRLRHQHVGRIEEVYQAIVSSKDFVGL
jgi:hypothetical protein